MNTKTFDHEPSAKTGHGISDDILFRAMDLIRRNSWSMSTIADLYRVNPGKLRRALNQKYGRDNIEREIKSAMERRSMMIGPGSAV